MILQYTCIPLHKTNYLCKAIEKNRHKITIFGNRTHSDYSPLRTDSRYPQSFQPIIFANLRMSAKSKFQLFWKTANVSLEIFCLLSILINRFVNNSSNILHYRHSKANSPSQMFDIDESSFFLIFPLFNRKSLKCLT